MITGNEIFTYLCELAPLEKQMSFDNSGFLIGRKEKMIRNVILALDVTEAVVDEAIDNGADMIISHHPVIFHPLKALTDSKLIKLAANDITVISMHTNLDIAEGGVNDVLLSLLEAEFVENLDKDNCGRVGILPKETALSDFLRLCRSRLPANGLRYYDAGRAVKKIAVLGGSGADALEDAAEKGCDTFLTADVKYHEFLAAQELGINLIDGDHFGTEQPVIPMLFEKLSARYPDVHFCVSAAHKAIIEFC